jgi:hypothetical protein
MTPDVTSLCSKPFFFFTVQMKIVRQHLFDWQSEIVSIHCPLHRYDRRIAKLKQLIFSTQASNDTGKSLKKMHSEYCVDVAERGKCAVIATLFVFLYHVIRSSASSSNLRSHWSVAFS